MFPYFETMACLDGKLQNLALHQARCLKTLEDAGVSGQISTWFSHPEIPETCLSGLYRVKLQYDGYTWQVDWFPYQRQSHEQLVFWEIGDFQYPYKYTDRTYFATCLQEAGHELWFHRKGQLLDTTYTHVAIWEGDQWITPANWLLPSTKRTRLVQEGLLQESVIHLSNLPTTGHLILYNALRDWEDIYRFVRTPTGLQIQLEKEEKVILNLRRFPK